MSEFADFFAGQITMGFVVCTVFFARFWIRAGDGLFLVIAGAFVLPALKPALTTERSRARRGPRSPMSAHTILRRMSRSERKIALDRALAQCD